MSSAMPWARAFAGALIFSLPMLMTMEMWWLGFYIEPFKLALLLVVSLPLLFGLADLWGFESTSTLADVAIDVFVAIFIAALMAVIVLTVFGILTPDMSLRELIGKVALQTFSGSVGALLAKSQLNDSGDGESEKSKRSQFQALFLMAVGAVFLGLNVAPTEEMVLLSYVMTEWHELALLLLSFLLLLGFTFVAHAADKEQLPSNRYAILLLRQTAIGYLIVLLISLYLLWTFGRLEGSGFVGILGAAIVLGFPSAIGAGVSRIAL